MFSMPGSGNAPDPRIADNAAAQTKLLSDQQTTHDANVAKGKASIDSAFSQFTPDYYTGVSKAYTDAYEPQLDNQYGIAKDKLTAQLAGNDTLESTGGINALSELNKTYGSNQAQIADQGVTAANTMKNSVANSQNNLYAMNASAADPSTAATQSQAQAGALVAPTAYPTLANVFGAALSPVAAAAKNLPANMYPTNASGASAMLPTGSGSGQVT